MAQLSERDRRILLGENFVDVERRAQEEARVSVTPEEKVRDAERSLQRNGDQQLTAGAMLVAGALMAWGAYRATNTLDVTADVGLLITLAGLVWAVFLVVKKKALNQTLRTFRPG